MRSLKGYAPKLATMLATTEAAIYEKQRTLVRAGLLKTIPGRGPGSGVPASPRSVALIMLAVMASESLSTTVSRVRTTAGLIYRSGKIFREGATLLDTLEELLSDPSRATEVAFLEVSRNLPVANIRGHWKTDKGMAFFGPPPKPKDLFFITATIENPAITNIAIELARQEGGDTR
jgi:hypothetical protein